MAEQLGLFDTRWAQPAAGVDVPLSIRESRRARRLILRLLPPHTLELVVPRGARPADVTKFINANSRWIQRARREIAARYPFGPERLPTRIVLPSVDQVWQVRYEHSTAAVPECRTVGDVLEVRALDADHRGADAVLRRWLLEQGRTYLAPWLLREAQLVGRRPSGVQIRLQRTRWGSCSSSGRISLNAGLLFLEPSVVRYLLIHELCHLLSLDHSRRFWQAVERYEPEFRTLDRRLTEAWAAVPLWAYQRARRGVAAARR